MPTTRNQNQFPIFHFHFDNSKTGLGGYLTNIGDLISGYNVMELYTAFQSSHYLGQALLLAGSNWVSHVTQVNSLFLGNDVITESISRKKPSSAYIVRSFLTETNMST